MGCTPDEDATIVASKAARYIAAGGVSRRTAERERSASEGRVRRGCRAAGRLRPGLVQRAATDQYLLCEAGPHQGGTCVRLRRCPATRADLRTSSAGAWRRWLATVLVVLPLVACQPNAPTPPPA